MLGEIGEAARTLLMDTAREKGIALLECQTIVDHVHMLVESESPAQLSWALKLLKGRSSFDLSRRYPELKLDGRVPSIWQRGFGKRLVAPREVESVRRHIQTQDQSANTGSRASPQAAGFNPRYGGLSAGLNPRYRALNLILIRPSSA